MAKWNRDQVSELIVLYEKCNYLYDSRNQCYHIKKKRDEAYLNIANLLKKIRPNTKVDEIKNKLKSLRFQYGKEKQRVEKSVKIGSAEIYAPRLWCFDQLNFLDQHVHSASPSDNESEITGITTKLDNSIFNQNQMTPVTPQFNGDTEKNSNQTREEVFASFVCSQLKLIRDLRIYNKTTWKIQKAINKGIEDFFSYTPPTPPRSSNNIDSDFSSFNWNEDEDFSV